MTDRRNVAEAAPEGGTAAAPTARIGPSPAAILDGLTLARVLERSLNAAEILAFDGQGADLPGETIAALFNAEEQIAAAGRLMRAEIARLEDLARAVAYVPPPSKEGARERRAPLFIVAGLR